MNNSSSSTESTLYFVVGVLYLVILAITLPAILLAIYVVYRQMRLKHAVHVYIINLFISDILQFISTSSWLFELEDHSLFSWILQFGLALNVSFMLCIAVERYLMIAHPLWYSVHCTVKCSILTSLGVWMVSLSITAPQCFIDGFENLYYIFSALLLLPFPLLPFLFVGTWRGLSKALTLSTREKRRILATLGLVIGSYTVLFLPFIIIILEIWAVSEHLVVFVLIFLCMNPLLDLLLYIFVRKDTRRVLEDIPCCRRSHTDREETDRTAVTSL